MFVNINYILLNKLIELELGWMSGIIFYWDKMKFNQPSIESLQIIANYIETSIVLIKFPYFEIWWIILSAWFKPHFLKINHIIFVFILFYSIMFDRIFHNFLVMKNKTTTKVVNLISWQIFSTTNYWYFTICPSTTSSFHWNTKKISKLHYY